MSFTISVYQAELLPPETDIKVGQEEWDEWVKAREELELYSAPLGADETVYLYWSLIAARLGLPLLARVYTGGLKVKHPSKLAQLRRELDKIEEFWKVNELEDPGPLSGIRHELKEHLQERLGYFREGIRVARENDGVLIVS